MEHISQVQEILLRLETEWVEHVAGEEPDLIVRIEVLNNYIVTLRVDRAEYLGAAQGLGHDVSSEPFATLARSYDEVTIRLEDEIFVLIEIHGERVLRYVTHRFL